MSTFTITNLSSYIQHRQKQCSTQQVESTHAPRFEIWATVVTGLEYIAAQELQKKFEPIFAKNKAENTDANQTSALIAFDKQCGKVLFSLPEGEDNVKKWKTYLKSMWTLEKIYSLIGCVCIDGFPQSSASKSTLSKEESLRKLEELIIEHELGAQRWQDAFYVWRTLRTDDANQQATDKIKFRVTAKRGGTHPFTSSEMAATIAAAIEKRFDNWEAETTDFDVEVFAHLTFDTIMIGMTITDQAQSLLKLSTDRQFTSTSLKPSIAYAMYKLADVQPGNIVVDPFCGTGTIPLVGAMHTPNALFIGGEISSASIAKASNNIAHHYQCKKKSRRHHHRQQQNNHRQSNIQLVQWDSTKLPLRKGSIDVMISNLPFGKQVGSHSHNRNVLYPQFFNEICRVLKRGARCVFLTTEKHLMLNEVKKHKYHLQLDKFHSIEMGGLHVGVYCIRKKDKTSWRKLRKEQKAKELLEQQEQQRVDEDDGDEEEEQERDEEYLTSKFDGNK